MAMQWSFSNKSSQLLSFNEEKPKTGFEALKSTGLVTITTTEAFDSSKKSYTGVMQKSKVPEKQEGVRYSITTHHPTKHIDRNAIRRSITNQMSITVSPKQSFTGQNRIRSISPQPISTLPPTNTAHAVGTTEARTGPKISNPDLLTIFYNGSVCVFDNVSPEKAQAIMLLAGNGPPPTPSTSSPIAPPQAATPRSSILDGFSLSQPYASPCLSPVPIKSISMSHTASLPSNRITTTTCANPVRILESSLKPEPLRAVYPIRSVPQTPVPSGTVPQFRRKSLARFLEKRKDRVISVSPYAEKQSPDSISFGQLR